VLGVVSERAHENAEALTGALQRAAARARKVQLMSGDFSLEVMALAMKCDIPPSATCLDRIGEKVGTDAFVWGTLEPAGDEVVVDLRLWQKAGPERQTELRYAANLADAADDDLLRIAQRAFSKLVAADEPIEPPPAAKSAPAPARLPAEASKDDESASSGPPASAYVALGAGALLVGGGVYSALRVNAINKDQGFDRYRRSLREDQDVCIEADKGSVLTGAPPPSEIADQCATGKTFQILQVVFLAAGAVAAGVGVYLLTTGGEANTARAPVRTRFALMPGSARASVSFAF
jgi:hypothetical protein